MSDWWYPGQLARQDQYGNPLPDEEWPAVQAAPEERAPLQITMRPPSAVKKELPPEFSPPDLPTQEHQSSFRRAMPKVYDPLQKQQQEVADFAYSFTPPGAISDIADAYQNKDPLGLILGVGGGIPGAGAGLKLAGKGVQAAARHPAATMGSLAAIGTMLGTDQAEAGKLSAAKTVMGELAQPFYSAAGRAVENAKLGKGTGEQWLGYLRNQPGVKQEELQHVFGNLPEGQLTKAQMQAHAAENAVTLGEVTKGIAPDAEAAGRTLAESHGNVWGELSRADRERYIRTADGRRLTDYGGDPKYSQWQLPGGENYRETLLTLPVTNAENAKFARLTEIEQKLRNPGDYDAPELNSLRAEYKRLADETRNVGAFQSSHWDEPNVLAHVRTNDREIPGVGKSLHVEEIQSDWHQKGRTQGYADPAADQKYSLARDAATARADKLSDEMTVMARDRDPVTNVMREESRWHQLARERNAALREAEAAQHNIGSRIPDAPFKSTWADVALKRQIREASEKGYDAISWTPGKAQAARYPDALRQAVSNISWSSPGAGGRANPDGLRYVHAQPNGGGTDLVFTINKDGAITEASTAAAKGKHVEDIFGKDMAKQIMGEAEGDIASKDFVIGAKGMEGFYDKMLVDKANAIGKKHGARVEQAEIDTKPQRGPVPEGSHDFSRNAPVHVLRITPELRAAAMKGFPLFTAGGVAATGVMGELARQDKYGRNE